MTRAEKSVYDKWQGHGGSLVFFLGAGGYYNNTQWIPELGVLTDVVGFAKAYYHDCILHALVDINGL